MSREAMKHIKTWSERCEKHPDHQTGMISERMIQERMQEEIDELRQSRSLTDELMDCVDRLGSEADTVDPRVWQHLLVYAPKPEEEPVAWISEGGDVSRSKRYMDEMGFKCNPLYTAPPKQWVGLTDEEVFELADTNLYDGGKNYGVLAFAKAIEQALKEKNHG